ncbi:MAG: hypothetical protein V7746_18805 [Halioglobus sp.]
MQGNIFPLIRSIFASTLLCAGLCSASNLALAGDKLDAYKLVSQYVTTNQAHSMVLSYEGEFIAVFNEQVKPWIEEPLTIERVQGIRATLDPHLDIRLNARGFAPAATRTSEGEEDETNYDAIWVRDNVWVYYALANNPLRQKDAKKLLLALWDYYATAPQLQRFKNIIGNPDLAQDLMEVPHIRFDGASAALSDVVEKGEAQVWNHRQIDAHGLFFTALGDAFKNERLADSEITPERAEVLFLYPLFLQKIQFHLYEDAGAWEEIPRRNSSSIGLATKSLQIWRDILYGSDKTLKNVFSTKLSGSASEVQKAWSKTTLDKQIANGMDTVHRQIRMGGESPDYDAEDVHYRRNDAALLHLISPYPLAGLSEAEMRQIMSYVETLKRPFGILRYNNDSYQGGNYWIRPPATEGPAPTGDTSSRDAFLWRLSTLPPNSEAQWFFDSLASLAWLHIAEVTEEPRLQSQDLHRAKIHLKRALGQLTGPNQIAADGKPVRAWMAPESINTVIVDGQTHFLASPITPLNWAKASLYMALREFERVGNIH